jgi:hypothetical protein
MMSVVMLGHDDTRSHGDRKSEDKNGSEKKVELFHMPKLTKAAEMLLYLKGTDLHTLLT